MTEARQPAAARQQRVGWFEIFYDLVIVAAVAHGSHLFASNLGLPLGTWLVITFVITFILWLSTSLAINIAPGDIPARKSLMFVQMIAVTMANLAVGRENGLPDSWGFAALAVAFATVALIYAGSCRAVPGVRSALGHGAVGMAIAAAIVALGIVLPDAPAGLTLLVLVLGVAVATATLAAVVVPRVCRGGRLRPEHLGERTGQFVIIVLGECFLALSLQLGALESVPNPALFLLALLLAGAIWAIYFLTIQPMGIPVTTGRLELWLLAVMVFLVGVAYSASLHAVYAANDWQTFGSSHPLAALPAFYVLLGAVCLSWIGGERREPSARRIHGGALVALLIIWVALLLLGQRAGNVLMALSSIIVLADAALSIAWSRRHRHPGGLLG